ncbi:hypothetical protein Zmor_007723 [Zophobas morio]|uniref:Uncharacterized protein n=1 Tax=Zophobas morio TaxID=2755281 RepID=A0AA38J2J6_9CUCU|nr:hypothetical protein Zmor_007723 [Zophobas morio]
MWSFLDERLVITYNPKTKIQVAVNQKAKTAPVLDYTYNISAMYNGNTGAAIFFNYETGISVYIPPGTSDLTWYSSKKSFDDYFGNLRTLKDLYHYGETHGISFDSVTITDAISEELVQIFEPLSSEYSSRCQSLATMLHISKITSDHFKTSMVGWPEVMGDVNSPFRGDFKWLVGMYQGIGDFFAEIAGGMGLLAQKRVKLDLGKILTQDGGIDVMIYLLEQLHPHFDIGKILGKALNSPERFFTLNDKFSGEMGYGFDGYIHVLAEIIRLYEDKSSIQNVEIALTDYCKNPKTSSKGIQEKWNGSVKKFLATIKKLKLDEALKDLTGLLGNITDNKWVYKGVNMSKIVEIVMKMDPSNVDSVPEVLKLLQEGKKKDLHV